MRSATTALERLAIVAVSLLLAFGLIALLSGFFAGRDPAGVVGGTHQLGLVFADQGHAHLSPGALHPAYDSNPPTSGAHVPRRIVRELTVLSDDQLLEALELGNVVIDYGTRGPPTALVALADAVAGPFSPQLAAAGQAVILAERPGIRGVIAVAWTRMLPVRSPADPRLREFIAQWLGHGASAAP